MKKYQLPEFLTSEITQAKYEKWLHGRAVAHVLRDRKSGNKTASNQAYKTAMHQAVLVSRGFDHYTRENLNWRLIGTYDNHKAKQGGRAYKKEFALMPSIDHVSDRKGPADFVVCSWRTNDSKNDLTYDEFLDLCRKVLAAEKKHNRS